MPRPKIHDESTKMALLEAGARVLAREGPAALTTRRVADEVGASTTAVYTLFGGKGGLVREIYIEGFARLAEAFAAVERGHDPVADLRALGPPEQADEVWDAALANSSRGLAAASEEGR